MLRRRAFCRRPGLPLGRGLGRPRAWSGTGVALETAPVTGVRDAHRFDERALVDHLAEHLRDFEGRRAGPRAVSPRTVQPDFRCPVPRRRSRAFVLRKQPLESCSRGAHRRPRIRCRPWGLCPLRFTTDPASKNAHTALTPRCSAPPSSCTTLYQDVLRRPGLRDESDLSADHVPCTKPSQTP